MYSVRTVQRNKSVCDVVTPDFQLQSRMENSAFADNSLRFLPLHSNVVVLYTIGLACLRCVQFNTNVLLSLSNSSNQQGV